jgi:transcriptional regulator with XRE-family HTH domain
VQGKLDIDSLGNVIKSARNTKQLTQCRLAEQLGITPRYLKAIENSGRKPSYDLLFRIICELDIAADEVFYPENGQQSEKIYQLRIAK